MSTEFKNLLVALLGAVVGAAATILTAGFGYLNKDRELDLRMVEIGLSILSGEKTENSEPARQFALDVLELYSGVTVIRKDEWVKTGDVPFQEVTARSSASQGMYSTASKFLMAYLQSTGLAASSMLTNPTIASLRLFNPNASEELRGNEISLFVGKLLSFYTSLQVPYEEGMTAVRAHDELVTLFSEETNRFQDAAAVLDGIFRFDDE